MRSQMELRHAISWRICGKLALQPSAVVGVTRTLILRSSRPHRHIRRRSSCWTNRIAVWKTLGGININARRVNCAAGFTMRSNGMNKRLPPKAYGRAMELLEAEQQA